MEQSIGLGIALGLLVGFVNEQVTYLWLSRLLRREMAVLLPFVKMLIWGSYLLKHVVLWVGMYVLFSRVHLNLLGFATGILAYQLCRIAWMILGLGIRLERR